MAEWSIAAVLKTVEVRASGGSNPSPSAIYIVNQRFAKFTHSFTHTIALTVCFFVAIQTILSFCRTRDFLFLYVHNKQLKIKFYLYGILCLNTPIVKLSLSDLFSYYLGRVIQPVSTSSLYQQKVTWLYPNYLHAWETSPKWLSRILTISSANISCPNFFWLTSFLNSFITVLKIDFFCLCNHNFGFLPLTVRLNQN